MSHRPTYDHAADLAYLAEIAPAVVIYVPAPDTVAARLIRPGSGIVAHPRPGASRVIAHFEGDLYGGIPRYADRVYHAFGRLAHNLGRGYPTVAKGEFALTDLVPVARWDHAFGRVEPLDEAGRAAIGRYLGLAPLPDAELEASGRTWAEARALATLEASDAPEDRARAQAMRRLRRR